MLRALWAVCTQRGIQLATACPEHCGQWAQLGCCQVHLLRLTAVRARPLPQERAARRLSWRQPASTSRSRRRSSSGERTWRRC